LRAAHALTRATVALDGAKRALKPFVLTPPVRVDLTDDALRSA
jgi:hypothetical protein